MLSHASFESEFLNTFKIMLASVLYSFLAKRERHTECFLEPDISMYEMFHCKIIKSLLKDKLETIPETMSFQVHFG